MTGRNISGRGGCSSGCWISASDKIQYFRGTLSVVYGYRARVHTGPGHDNTPLGPFGLCAVRIFQARAGKHLPQAGAGGSAKGGNADGFAY